MMKSVDYTAVKGLLLLLLLSLFSAHTVKTALRNLDWTSDQTIYASAVRVNPNNGPMLTNLGVVYVLDKSVKNYTFAEQLFRRCVEVAPEYPRGFSNLAGLLEATKRKREAEQVRQCASCVTISPSVVFDRWEMGSMYRHICM